MKETRGKRPMRKHRSRRSEKSKLSPDQQLLCFLAPLSDVREHHDIMADASAHDEEVEDLVGAEVLVF